MSTDVGLHLLASEISAVGLGLCRRRADAPDRHSQQPRLPCGPAWSQSTFRCTPASVPSRPAHPNRWLLLPNTAYKSRGRHSQRCAQRRSRPRMVLKRLV